MEKLQTLAWILIGLAMFIWRMVQKARATTEQERRERKFSRPDSTGRPRPVAPLPATSFEELLKQMQTQNRPGPPAEAEKTMGGRAMPRQPEPQPRSQERTTVEAKSLEKYAPARSLEVPAPEARRATSLPRPAPQPQPDYWRQEQTSRAAGAAPNAIAGRLRNPADVRTAFILGEILQRKF